MNDRDPSHWSFWWVLENQRYLDLRKDWIEEDESRDTSTAMMGRLAPSSDVISDRVVPELLARLAADDHHEVVSSSLIALARSTTEESGHRGEVQTALREHVHHSNQKVRESAVLGLGLLGSESGGNDLVGLLGESAPAWLGGPRLSIRTRAFAAHGLGLAAIRVQDPEVRRRWALALTRELEAPDSHSITFQIAAVEALGLFSLDEIPASAAGTTGSEHVVSQDSLAQFLSSWVDAAPRRNTWVRSHAAVAAGRAAVGASATERAATITQLTKVIRNRRNHAYIRTGAAIGLGEVANSGKASADRRAREALIDLMKKGQALEARFARMALVAASVRPGAGEEPFAGEHATRRALLADLKRSRTDELGWTALALGRLDWQLRRAGVSTGTETAKALARVGRKRRGDDSSSALGLGLALAIQGTKEARSYEEHLLDEFHDISSPLRKSFMALALGLARTPGVKDALLAEIKGSNAQSPLLWNASLGLVQLDHPVETLLADIVDSSSSTAERRAAIRTLGQAGGARSVDRLLNAVASSEEQDLLRADAIDALASICDREPLTWRDAYSHGLPYFAATQTLNGSGNDSAIIERPW